MPRLIHPIGFVFAISLLFRANGQTPVSAATEIPPLAYVTNMTLPIYPRLARSAHDARIVRVKLKPESNKFIISQMVGGNKYFDTSIRNAISDWRVSKLIPLHPAEFWITIDFRVSADMTEETTYKLDLDESRLVLYGKIRFTDTEKLPINTAKWTPIAS